MHVRSLHASQVHVVTPLSAGFSAFMGSVPCFRPELSSRSVRLFLHFPAVALSSYRFFLSLLFVPSSNRPDLCPVLVRVHSYHLLSPTVELVLLRSTWFLFCLAVCTSYVVSSRPLVCATVLILSGGFSPPRGGSAPVLSALVCTLHRS